MASTYTDAGIELIGVGEQSNTWGQTTNTNWRLMEEMVTGVVQINLNGLTSFNLTTTDGVTSNGRHAIIEFTGAPGAAATVTVNPDDMQKLYFINNATDQIITITQGSGNSVTVPVGTKKIVYCDGAGGGAAVTDLTENLSLSGEVNVTTLKINGVEVTADAAEINTLDGLSASTAELNVLDGITATTAELNKVDGFTGNKDDLNYAKDLRATGVTASEFDKLDGVPSSGDLVTASTHYVPSGGIIMWSGSIGSIPSGWSLCDGTNGTPDLRDRFVVGAGGSYAVDATGGADSVTLTENQIPSHNHSMNSAGDHSHSTSISDPGHSHGYKVFQGENPDGGNNVRANDQTGRIGSTLSSTTGISVSINNSGSHTHTINNTGGDAAHENRPPYYALAYIMKL